MALKDELYALINLKVGSGKDLLGADANVIFKEVYETAEAYLAEEALARAVGDATLSGQINDLIVGQITALSDAISALESDVNLLDDYQIVGIATTSTNPGTVQKKAWFARANGTYSNFRDDENQPYVLENELVIFLVNNDAVQKVKLADLPDQELLTTSNVTFNKLTITDLPTGTLLVQPSGIEVGDWWLDTTDSVSNPCIRIKMA